MPSSRPARPSRPSPPLRPDSLPPAFHAERRQALARKVRDGVVVLTAAPVFPRQRDDQHHPYAPDPHLRYLSGCAEPHSALILAVANGKIAREILFCRPRNPAAEQWEGERMGPERARRRLGVDEAAPGEEFEKKLRQVAAQFSDIWFIPGARRELDSRILALTAARRAANRAGAKPVAALRDVSIHLDEMRMIKTPHEIAAMRHAADIAVAAMRAAMRAAKSARRECEIESVLIAEYRRNNAHHAFAPIVAAGQNACCLHYRKNSARIRPRDLILVDTGCEARGYCSDITRVFPAGGKFTPAQRDVAEIVLDAHKKAAAKVRPGGKMDAPENAAAKAVAAGLRELKLLKGTPESIVARQLHKRFYMHRVGHFLGMDTHDAGRMIDDAGAPRKFAPGMVVTIEPGAYIPDAPDIPRELRGIGVRIEDDILVTRGGSEALTADAPKSPREVEAWMN